MSETERTYYCPHCEEDVLLANRLSHYNSTRHMDNGREYVSSIHKNFKWFCPICSDGKPRKDVWRHKNTKMHKRNEDLLREKGLPIPDLFDNNWPTFVKEPFIGAVVKRRYSIYDPEFGKTI